MALLIGKTNMKTYELTLPTPIDPASVEPHVGVRTHDPLAVGATVLLAVAISFAL